MTLSAFTNHRKALGALILPGVGLAHHIAIHANFRLEENQTIDSCHLCHIERLSWKNVESFERRITRTEKDLYLKDPYSDQDRMRTQIWPCNGWESFRTIEYDMRSCWGTKTRIMHCRRSDALCVYITPVFGHNLVSVRILRLSTLKII